MNKAEVIILFLVAIVFFLLGVITWYYFPRDSMPSQIVIPTPIRDIIDQTTSNGITCTTYTSENDAQPVTSCVKQ